VAPDIPGQIRDRIVTLESLQPPINESLESFGTGAAQPELASIEGRLKLARYYQIMERLRQETGQTGSSLMVTAPDREVSRLQSEVARQAAEATALDSGGLEVKFGTGVGGGDWLGWIFSLMDHVGRNEAHPMVRPTTTIPETLPDEATIAMAADWGTGLYGAPKIAESIRKSGPYDLLMHLGDIYYSGTEAEVRDRFLALWPKGAGKRTIAVNSNH
jgi:hypothetical protein